MQKIIIYFRLKLSYRLLTRKRTISGLKFKLKYEFHSANRLCSGPNGIEDLKNHAFFASIDWDKLLKKQVGLSSVRAL